MDISHVFTSPLLRSLQSAEILFENHSNYKNIKFVILPELTEIFLNI